MHSVVPLGENKVEPLQQFHPGRQSGIRVRPLVDLVSEGNHDTKRHQEAVG